MLSYVRHQESSNQLRKDADCSTELILDRSQESSNPSSENVNSETELSQLVLDDVSATPNHTPSIKYDTIATWTQTTIPCDCIECIYEEQVVDLNQIKVGNHILFPRAKYDHHAIVIKADDPVVDRKTTIMVAHATNTTLGFSFRSGKAHLIIETIDIDLNKDKVIIYRYRPWLKPFPPEEVAKRAQIGVYRGFSRGFVYNLFQNNCEHFATYCVLGRRVSFQASKAKLVFNVVRYGNGFEALKNDKARNFSLYHADLLCRICFERNKCLLEVPYTPIINGYDVNIGDVINYDYYNISHYAIVTKVIEQSFGGVKCNIVHYKFNFFRTNNIGEDIFFIPSNGSVKLVRYESRYEVYEPEVVVKNALGRIGYQRFVYFVNDSQHLAQMCKIRSNITGQSSMFLSLKAEKTTIG